MKIIIIGSGLAGTVAQRSLSNHDVEVYDRQSYTDVFKSHSAVMRFRDERLARILGISLNKVTVYKAYALGGKLYTEPNITANNLYSLKTHNSLGNRSLLDCGVQERYLPIDPINSHNIFGNYVLLQIDKNESGQNCASFSYNNGDDMVSVPYDYCISTIPMPSLLEACNIDHNLDFRARTIRVYTGSFIVNSTVHQTVYFPETEDVAYRITIEGNKIIAECMEEAEPEELETLIEKYFGITIADYAWTAEESQIGKLVPINDNSRRALMVELNKLSIYSLGRHAIWKSIRADHLISDIEKIKHFITVSEEARNYESNIDTEYPKRGGDGNTLSENAAFKRCK